MLVFRSYLAIAAVLTSAVVCVYALTLEEGPDVKLALAAYSAAIAAYSAWSFTWREPIPRFISVIAVLNESDSKRILVVYNHGALPAWMRIAKATSQDRQDRRYEVSHESIIVHGHSFGQVPITAIGDGASSRDHVEIVYTFSRGSCLLRKKAFLIWEGIEDGRDT